MNRRGLGRARLLMALGAASALLACFLPWYTVGGQALPALSRNAFDGAGILVFLAVAAVLALLCLPYAAGDAPTGLDRPLIFALVVTVGVMGFVLRIVQLQAQGLLTPPDRGLGLWLAGLGLAVVVWGVAELGAESRTR